MEPPHIEEYKALMQLAEFNIARFDHRREYSWKVSIGFWAAILGSAAVIKDINLALSLSAVILIGGLILLCIPWLHAYWLRNVFEANNLARDLLSEDFEPSVLQSEIEAHHQKMYHQDWSVRFQFDTTFVLTVALVYFFCLLNLGRGEVMAINSQTFIVVGLFLDLAGTILIAWGLVTMSRAEIDNASRSMYGSNPATVVSFLAQRRGARWGIGLLIVGFVLQIIGSWPRGG